MGDIDENGAMPNNDSFTASEVDFDIGEEEEEIPDEFSPWQKKKKLEEIREKRLMKELKLKELQELNKNSKVEDEEKLDTK